MEVEEEEGSEVGLTVSGGEVGLPDEGPDEGEGSGGVEDGSREIREVSCESPVEFCTCWFVSESEPESDIPGIWEAIFGFWCLPKFRCIALATSHQYQGGIGIWLTTKRPQVCVRSM